MGSIFGAISFILKGRVTTATKLRQLACHAFVSYASAVLWRSLLAGDNPQLAENEMAPHIYMFRAMALCATSSF
jgi:hypothetical protein